YTHDTFGSAYAENGLLALLKRPSAFPDEFERVVDALAWRLVNVGKGPLLAEGPTVASLSATVDAFRGERAAGGVPAAAPKGPRAAGLVYIAGKTQEMQGIRTSVDAYDSVSGAYWKPFYPADKPISQLASMVALQAKLTPGELELHPNLIEDLRTAEE